MTSPGAGAPGSSALHTQSLHSAPSCRSRAFVEKVFPGGKAPIASISFFPARRATRDGKNFRLSGRWRFNSGIGHAELVVEDALIEGSEVENGGKPIVMFSVFPKSAAKLYDEYGAGWSA